MPNSRFCSLTVIFVITLTLHVIECPVMAPLLGKCSACLLGWGQASKFNTDHIWGHGTVSNGFNNSIGVGYCGLSRLIATYINFDLTVQSMPHTMILTWQCSPHVPLQPRQLSTRLCDVTSQCWSSTETESCLNCVVFCVEEWDGWDMWHVWETGEVHAGCW